MGSGVGALVAPTIMQIAESSASMKGVVTAPVAGRVSARLVKHIRAVRIRVLVFIASFGTASSVRAQPPDGQVITAPRVVVLATVDTRDAGRREALRAAKLLGYSIAMDTVSTVPRQRRYVGEVIALHRNRSGKIAVTSYLGDVSDVDGHLRAAKRYFPKATVVPTVLPPEERQGSDGWIDRPYIRAGVLVVGSHRSYHAAVRAAKTFSETSGISYSSQGMIFDEARGLIIPDDDPDEAYRGQYVPRRYDDACDQGRCVTVERSDAYDGFRPGLYIAVAGILGRDAEARARLKQAQRIVPTAYVRQTILYMGCMH